MADENYGLEEIHQNLLKALNELNSICIENEICYSLHGGTLLGAERNNKMIPWDDDMDVSMTRQNFEKLLNVMKKYKGNYFISDSSMWVPRFTTKSVSTTEFPVFIDIFIWDYIDSGRLKSKIKLTLLRALQGMIKKEPKYDGFSVMQKLLIGTTHLLGKIFSLQTKMHMYNWVETNVLVGNKTHIHRSNDSFRGMSYILDQEYMKNYTFLELEGKKYMVNTRYREFLIMEYGQNYMTPPPASERVAKHEEIRKDIGRKNICHEKKHFN